MIDHTEGGHTDADQTHTGARAGQHRSGTLTSEGSGTPPDAAMRVLSYVIAGIVIYGGLGWLIDRTWHQSWGVPVGLILGMGLSIYMIIRRFGRQQ